MKIISKAVKFLNLKWMKKDGEKEVEVKGALVDVTIQVKVPEVADFVEWGIDSTSEDEAVSKLAMVRLANVEFLIASQLKQHQGSSAYRARAVKVMRDGADRKVQVDDYVYEHDFDTMPGEVASGEDKLKAAIAKFTGVSVDKITPEVLAAMKSLVKVDEEEAAE